MAKADKELKSKIEDAIKLLKNTKIEHPGVSDNRVKQIKENVEKLMQKYEE